MAEQNDVIIAMQGAIRKALCEAANEEIERLKHRFECKMGEVKANMVGKLVEQIEIVSRHDPIRGMYTIQVNICPIAKPPKEGE